MGDVADSAVADGAVAWLLRSREPAISGMTRRDLLDEARPSDLGHVLDGPLVRGLLAGQQPDGGFGAGLQQMDGRALAAGELGRARGSAGRAARDAGVGHRARLAGQSAALARRPTTASGLPLSDGSIEGNALAAACRLGTAGDERVERLVDALLLWQWPDGGWNCDLAPGRRSSFHESLVPMWGLWEYARATGMCARARPRTGPQSSSWTIGSSASEARRADSPEHGQLHFPAYWHYDVLQALHLLARMGKARDERTGDALDLLEQRRLPDGRWRPGGYWWSPPGSAAGPGGGRLGP